MESAQPPIAPGRSLTFAAGVGALLAVLAAAQSFIRLDPHEPTPTAVFVVAALVAAVALAGRNDASVGGLDVPEPVKRPGAWTLIRLGYGDRKSVV